MPCFHILPRSHLEITIKTWLPKNKTALVYNFLWTKQPYWTARHLFRESCEKVRMFSFPSTVMGNPNKTIKDIYWIGYLDAVVHFAETWVQTHGGNWETISLPIPQQQQAWDEDECPEVICLFADLYSAYNTIEEEINLANNQITLDHEQALLLLLINKEPVAGMLNAKQHCLWLNYSQRHIKIRPHKSVFHVWTSKGFKQKLDTA